jgi:hypothetical protein
LSERIVPSSSSLMLDLSEGVEINVEALDEIKEILMGEWNQTANNLENQWQWFRRRLAELRRNEFEVPLVVGIESVGGPAGQTAGDD